MYLSGERKKEDHGGGVKIDYTAETAHFRLENSMLLNPYP